jgi:hypothetical protein
MQIPRHLDRHLPARHPGSYARYRALAANLRTAAPAFKLQTAKDELMLLAADYERLADYVAGMNRLVDLLLRADEED